MLMKVEFEYCMNFLYYRRCGIDGGKVRGLSIFLGSLSNEWIDSLQCTTYGRSLRREVGVIHGPTTYVYSASIQGVSRKYNT